ncbi:MAG: FmdB family zinc ribbon protein [Verrucomicrobiota bacterium]
MPIREYVCQNESKSCAHCRTGFEQLEKADQSSLEKCPKCGAPVERRLSSPALGHSQSSLDERAKRAGFHKLKKLGRGEYEKQY